jgi:hypothetical protein
VGILFTPFGCSLCSAKVPHIGRGPQLLPDEIPPDG